MKKLVLALAGALTLVANAAYDNWFSGGASGTELTCSNATWTTSEEGVTVENNVLELDLADTELMLTPTEGTAPDTNTTTKVVITANFYPCDVSDLEPPKDAIQTALVVAYDGAVTNYYAYTGSEWVALVGETPVFDGGAPVTATIELDYYDSTATRASFKIGEKQLTYNDSATVQLGTTERALVSVAFTGGGKLSSVQSSVELGVAEVDGRKYPSLAEAVAAVTAGETIALLRDSEEEAPAGWVRYDGCLVRDDVAVDIDETPTAQAPVTVLVAVPKPCTAATLVDATNRAAGDVLKVYSKKDKCYYTWELTAGGVWEPKWTFQITENDSIAHSEAASAVDLAAGQSAWVTIKSAEPVKLLVTYNAAPVAVAVEKGWNLVAPTTPGTKTVSAVIESLGENVGANDAIVIPAANGGAPKIYNKIGGNWGYDDVEYEIRTIKGQEVKVAKPVRKTDDTTIKAGTGVWFVNGGESDKSINL